MGHEESCQSGLQKYLEGKKNNPLLFLPCRIGRELVSRSHAAPFGSYKPSWSISPVSNSRLQTQTIGGQPDEPYANILQLRADKEI